MGRFYFWTAMGVITQLILIVGLFFAGPASSEEYKGQWVLIAWSGNSYGYRTPSNALVAQDFNDYDACVSAMKTFHQIVPQVYQINTECVPKGSH